MTIAVLKRQNVRREIISRMNRKVFTQEQVEMIYQKLLKYTYITSSTKSEHISQVNSIKT